MITYMVFVIFTGWLIVKIISNTQFKKKKVIEYKDSYLRDETAKVVIAIGNNIGDLQRDNKALREQIRLDREYTYLIRDAVLFPEKTITVMRQVPGYGYDGHGELQHYLETGRTNITVREALLSGYIKPPQMIVPAKTKQVETKPKTIEDTIAELEKETLFGLSQIELNEQTAAARIKGD